MYRKFYGFRERPFELTPNPRYLVLTKGHREALSHLEYGIASRKGITLLIGEAGTGKTTVIRTALERQTGRSHCVHLQNPALTRAEFIEMLAARFELPAEARTSKTVMLLQLETLLKTRHDNGETTVLIVDEAQSVPFDLLEEIRLLANIETTEGKLLSVVLAGQPELAARLNEPELRQLKQRIALRCELRPLTAQETPAYIAGRIAAAGGVAAQVFTREAVLLMHQQSRGIPRTISVIADNALVSGFALAERPVTAARVAEVCRDLDLAPLDDGAFLSERATTAVTAPAGRTPQRLIAPPSVAAGPTAPATPAAAVGPRILSFGGTAAAARTAVEPEPDALQANTGDEARAEAFSEPAPKRRRFLFF